MREGPWAFWFENGNKKSAGAYKNGKRDGAWLARRENGTATWKGTFENGERHGPWTFWYESGKKKSEGAAKNGEKNGPWTSWYENGKKKSKGSYKNGRKDGPWTYWLENGKKSPEPSLDSFERRYVFSPGALRHQLKGPVQWGHPLWGQRVAVRDAVVTNRPRVDDDRYRVELSGQIPPQNAFDHVTCVLPWRERLARGDVVTVTGVASGGAWANLLDCEVISHRPAPPPAPLPDGILSPVQRDLPSATTMAELESAYREKPNEWLGKTVTIRGESPSSTRLEPDGKVIRFTVDLVSPSSDFKVVCRGDGPAALPAHVSVPTVTGTLVKTASGVLELTECQVRDRMKGEGDVFTPAELFSALSLDAERYALEGKQVTVTGLFESLGNVNVSKEWPHDEDTVALLLNSISGPGSHNRIGCVAKLIPDGVVRATTMTVRGTVAKRFPTNVLLDCEVLAVTTR